MDYFLIYLWTRLDALIEFFGTIGIITSFLFIIGTAAIFIENFNKKFLLLWFVPIIIFLLTILIPNQKDFALIYVLPKLAHNKTVKSIGVQSLNVPDKLLKLANTKLDELLQVPKELKQNNE